ncbi:MAG TPA: hypothetical protein PLJ97_01465, partial [Candidatus Saccharibacteria bacterium]|nr:hypothetical protein [Candidatus Saccharibacteria bacterium]
MKRLKRLQKRYLWPERISNPTDAHRLALIEKPYQDDLTNKNLSPESRASLLGAASQLVEREIDAIEKREYVLSITEGLREKGENGRASAAVLDALLDKKDTDYICGFNTEWLSQPWHEVVARAINHDEYAETELNQMIRSGHLREAAELASNTGYFDIAQKAIDAVISRKHKKNEILYDDYDKYDKYRVGLIAARMGFSGVDAVIRVLDHQLKTTLEREATERWASDHYIEGKVIHIKLQKIEILVEAGCVEEAKACIAECQIPKEQLWGFYGRKYGLLASKAGDKKTAKKTMVDLQEIGDELSACMIAVKLGDSESAREYLKNNLSNCNDEQDISDMGMLAIEIGDDT